MNRNDLQQLAEERALDAEALLNTQRSSGAYYIAGYAVECALKACIAKQTDLHAYGEVLRLAAQMGNPYLDPFRVKLVSTSDPLAQAAIDIHRRFPGRIATRFGGNNFGGMSVDGVFIYPATETTVTP